jgi:TRAP-type C4-dicarboxylate transport system substrate-binding protein
MNGVACMEVFPDSKLYDDDKVLEAMLNGDVHVAAPSLSRFKALDASPQKMAFSEVHGALQTGLVDGQENTCWTHRCGSRLLP